jgi:outer membrane protein TolC
VRAHLIDEPDLLTSIAQAKSKEFDLKTAIDNVRVAERSFNSARGMDSDSVPEPLMSLAPEALQSLQVPERSELRDDVKAAEQNTIVTTAKSDIATQNTLPILNVVGTVSTNGLDPSLNTSFHDTLTANNPYYQIGVNLTVPLDFGEVTAMKRAYAEQMKGAELTYRRRLFDQENDWKDLVKKLGEAKERLAIAVDVENAEKLKYDHESVRQKQGVTTTYQVFQYDLDYLTSQLNRIQTQSIILNLIAQMKTYRSGT